MNIIFIVFFVICVIVIVRFGLYNIINLFADYTNVTGVIVRNYRNGKYVVKFYKNPWISTYVNVISDNIFIPEGTIVTIEKTGFFKYRIYCYITKD